MELSIEKLWRRDSILSPLSVMAGEHSASYHSMRLLRSETCHWIADAMNVSLGHKVVYKRRL